MAQALRSRKVRRIREAIHPVRLIQRCFGRNIARPASRLGATDWNGSSVKVQKILERQPILPGREKWRQDVKSDSGLLCRGSNPCEAAFTAEALTQLS